MSKQKKFFTGDVIAYIFYHSLPDHLVSRVTDPDRLVCRVADPDHLVSREADPFG